jgi:long-chain acyl-CoA synthetase
VKAINADARPARAAGLPGRHRQAWTVDNDLITPTFKVKRNRIEDLYASRYDTWVGARKTVIWEG